MTYSLSIGGSRAIATAKRRRFRLIFAVCLILQVLIGIAAIVCPVWLGHKIGMDLSGLATGWARAWGVLMLVFCFFQSPGYQNPIDGRVCVMIGLVGRAILLITYLAIRGPFLWLALLEAVLLVLILVSFQSLIKAEVMSRP